MIRCLECFECLDANSNYIYFFSFPVDFCAGGTSIYYQTKYRCERNGDDVKRFEDLRINGIGHVGLLGHIKFADGKKHDKKEKKPLSLKILAIHFVSVEPMIDTTSLFTNRVHNELAYSVGVMRRAVGEIKEMLEMKVNNNNIKALVYGRKTRNIIIGVHLDNREFDRVEELLPRDMVITADGDKTRENGVGVSGKGTNCAHT